VVSSVWGYPATLKMAEKVIRTLIHSEIPSFSAEVKPTAEAGLS